MKSSLGKVVEAGLRRSLKRIWFFRSAYYLLISVLELARDTTTHSRLEFVSEFEKRVDPWSFETVEGQKRLRSAIEMLDRASAQRPLGRGLEIGCAEGAFTELLMERCSKLSAVDFVPLALERARRRRSWPASLTFEWWDLRNDPVPGEFDLIATMDVLTYILRPKTLKTAVRKLTSGLRPGGFLLVTDPRQSQMFECTWWGRYLLRGGSRIADFIARDSSLVVVETQETKTHVLRLFQKRL